MKLAQRRHRRYCLSPVGTEAGFSMVRKPPQIAVTRDQPSKATEFLPSPTSSFFCLISDEPSSPVRLIHCNCLGYHGRIGGISNIVTNGRQFSVDILML